MSAEQIVALICCYNGRQHLDELLPSLQARVEPGLEVRVVVVDDHSSDDSADHVRHCFPWVDCVATGRNLGFAGANNFGWNHVRRTYPLARYLALLNQDTVVRCGWLTPLVAFMTSHPGAAAVQPMILLYDQAEVINTVGNCSHYLGFGLLQGYGERADSWDREPAPIAFPSGCATLLRTDRLDELGLFDDRFYMYLEDADLGWKLRQAGYEVWSVPASRVWHKYAPGAHWSHYGYLERNRWILLLTYYSARTLVVLWPALVAMEVGQLLFAAGNGLLKEKLWSWSWFLRVEHVRYVLERRRVAAARRRVGDRQLLDRHVASVHLPTGDPWLLRWIGNPVLRWWWAVARRWVAG